MKILTQCPANANDQALRAGQIVRRLRDFMARREIEFRIESSRTLVEDTAALALLGAEDAGVLLTVTLDPGADLVLVDKIQVQQVLTNLLRNSMEAMQVSDRRELAISTASAENEMVLVSVADSGPGIPDEIAVILFQPFVTTKQKGHGRWPFDLPNHYRVARRMHLTGTEPGRRGLSVYPSPGSSG